MNYSIVIPAFNESEAIRDQLEEIKKKIFENKINAEIIVIDDGSTDDTHKILKKFQYNDLVIKKNISNLGYGKSIKLGVNLSKYENIIIIDCDMSYPFAEINNLKESYEKGYDMVIAERTNLFEHDGLLKSLMRSVFKFLVNYISGNKVSDPNSGFRIFKKNIFIKHMNIISDGFSMSTSSLLSFIFERSSIRFIPIKLRKRKGKSKIKLSRDILRMLQTVIQVCLHFNPIKIFVSFFIFFLLITFFAYLADYFLSYNFIIYKVLLIFFTLQSLFLGLISEVLRKK